MWQFFGFLCFFSIIIIIWILFALGVSGYGVYSMSPLQAVSVFIILGLICGVMASPTRSKEKGGDSE
jgi:apolipoprotein N-acyltransferase